MKHKIFQNNFFYALSFLFITAAMFSCGSSRKAQKNIPEVQEPSDTVVVKEVIDSAAIKIALKEKAIQLKYAAYLKTSPSEIKSIRLYTFIDEWMGVPFLMGGTTKDGIDCSAFVQRLFLDVYRIQLPRTVIEQLKSARIEPFGSLKYVAEGDIIFFHTADNKYVSHVGVYLCNNMFINASTTSGVTISRLNSPYWRDAFILAGRVKSSFAKNAIPVQPILAGPGD